MPKPFPIQDKGYGPVINMGQPQVITELGIKVCHSIFSIVHFTRVVCARVVGIKACR